MSVWLAFTVGFVIGALCTIVILFILAEAFAPGGALSDKSDRY